MKITYTNEILNAHHGQIDCEAGIYVNGEIVGYVQYVLYGDELTISDIFVKPEERRKGYASRLVNYILKENPKYEYVESMKTEDGAKFVHKNIKESVISPVLKPKTDAEILDSLIGLFDSMNWNLSDLIEENGYEDLNNVAKLINSDAKDVVIVTEEDSYYEVLENALRMIINKSGRPDYIHYEDSDFSYAISRKFKIAFGSSMAAGINVLFFNKPFVLDLFKNG